jgi:hypothetical protein
VSRELGKRRENKKHGRRESLKGRLEQAEQEEKKT